MVNISTREVRSQLIHDFKLKELGIDFMGYEFELKDASYHHLLVPRRMGGLATYENGAVLIQNTAHNYLHTIERYDMFVFRSITDAIQEEKILGSLDIDALKYIRNCLLYFEDNYDYVRTKKGKPVIKKEYITKRKI